MNGRDAKKFGQPVLTEGASGAWDDSFVSEPWVGKRNGIIHMLYAGNTGDGKNQIGLANSTDGYTFIKYASNPVLSLGTSGQWDDEEVRWPRAYYDATNHWWHVIYTGYDGSKYRLGHAYGRSLTSLTKYAGNPVLDVGAGGTWDDNFAAISSNPVLIGGTYYILYGGQDGANWQTGAASFTDWNSTWSKNASNPIIARRSTARAQLTATLPSGSTIMRVADTSVFVPYDVLFLDNGAICELNQVASIDSSTQITLRSAVQSTWTTSHYATSFMYGSVTPAFLAYDSNGWRAHLSPFNMLALGNRELSTIAMGASLTSLSIDYEHSPILPFSNNAADWDGLTSENEVMIVDFD